VNVLEKGEEPIADGREGILGFPYQTPYTYPLDGQGVEPGSIDEDLFYKSFRIK
jgi:hypothetical protein